MEYGMASADDKKKQAMHYTINDIDIFIITHNRATLLCETIKSVVNQTEDIKKFYVLDNESTDNTEEVAKSFSDRGCIYIKTFGKNGNFLKAQEMCTGKYVMTFHDDDLLHPEFFEKMLMMLNSVDNIAYCMSTFTWFPVAVMTPYVPKVLQKSLPMEYLFPQPMINACLVLENSFEVAELILRSETPPYPRTNPCICSVIYRSDIFKARTPLNEIYGKVDDIPLMISMAKQGRAVLYLDTRAVFHRTHMNRDGFNEATANTFEQSCNWIYAFTNELDGKNRDDLYAKLVYMICQLYHVITKKDVVKQYPTKRFIQELIAQKKLPATAIDYIVDPLVAPAPDKPEMEIIAAQDYFKKPRLSLRYVSLKIESIRFRFLSHICRGKTKKEYKRKYLLAKSELKKYSKA